MSLAIFILRRCSPLVPRTSALAPVLIGVRRSERPWVRPPIDEEILTGDVAGLLAAKVGAGVAELVGVAEAARRNRFHARGVHFLNWLALCLCGGDDGALQPVGVERTRQQVVDGDVVRHGLAGNAGHEA